MKFLLLLAFCSSIFMNDADYYNSIRRGFAKSNGVPNMWKLRRNFVLETAARVQLPENCSKLAERVSLHDYRYFLTSGGDAERRFNAYWLNWFGVTEKTDPAAVAAKLKEWEKSTAHFWEIVNPSQTMIGCIPKVCQVRPEPRKEYPAVITYERICLFGFRKKIDINLPINETSGIQPGSACGPNGKNEGGLCVNKN